jgi:hypothetical protein
MNETDYKELVSQRNMISKQLEGQMPARYRTLLEADIREIRKKIKDAHREQYITK